MVGRAGFEPATNGLKVRKNTYFHVLKGAAVLYINQHLTPYVLNKNTASVVIYIPQNGVKLATQRLHRKGCNHGEAQKDGRTRLNASYRIDRWRN